MKSMIILIMLLFLQLATKAQTVNYAYEASGNSIQ